MGAPTKSLGLQSFLKFVVLILALVILALSLIQASYLTGLMSILWLVIIYYVLVWLAGQREATSRLDTLDERVLRLEKKLDELEAEKKR